MPHTRTFRVARIAGGVELLRGVYVHHRFPPHAQETLVVGIVKNGEAVVHGGGRSLRLTAGSVLVIPPHVLHEASNVGVEPWHYEAFYLTRAQLAAIAGAAGIPPSLVGSAPCVLTGTRVVEQTVAVHDLLWNSAAEPKTVQTAAMELPLQALLWSLGSRIARKLSGVSATAMETMPLAIARVRALVDAQPFVRHSLASMADVANVSRFAFAHAFTRSYGVSPHAYVLQRRIAAVRQLLAAGEGLSRAALQVGFVDQSHLTRRFLSVVGVTPGEFRRAWRGAGALTARESLPPSTRR